MLASKVSGFDAAWSFASGHGPSPCGSRLLHGEVALENLRMLAKLSCGLGAAVLASKVSGIDAAWSFASGKVNRPAEAGSYTVR